MDNSRQGTETHNSGSGQSVSVTISSGSVRWVVVAIIALIALLIWTDRTASKAEFKADAAMKSATDSANELRLAQYWIQQAHAICLTKGVDVPGDPFLKAADK